MERSIYSKGKFEKRFSLDERSEISARDSQKRAWEFKTVNSIMMTKC
jgi:hypothetical protein